MICFNKNILIILMIFESFMIFNRAMEPSNEGFRNCCKEMESNFFFYELAGFGFRTSDLFAEGSRIKCIKHAIVHLSENDDDLTSDVRNYYSQFPGHANPNNIKDQTTFCTHIITEDSEVSVQVNPRDLLSHPRLESLTGFQVYPGELISRQQLEPITAKLYINRDDEISECVRQLSAIFGSSKEEILDKALRIYRIRFYEDKYYTLDLRTFGLQYLIHIKHAIELKDDSDLLNPWDYCCDRYPDDKSVNANTEDQASSSNQEMN